MQASQADQTLPELPCILELNPALGRVAVEGDSLHDTVRSGVLHDLTNIMNRLGIPGSPTLQMIPFRDLSTENELLRLSIYDQAYPYLDDVMTRAWSCVINRPWSGNQTAKEILAAFQSVSDQPEDDLIRAFYNFLGYSCLEMIGREPSILLHPPQVERYIEQLAPLMGEGALLPDVALLLPMLHTILGCKISIKDTATVAHALSSMQDRSPELMTEELIEELLTASGTQDITIHISPVYLGHLTTLDLEKGPQKFVDLRDTLWRATGMIYPSFRFVINDAPMPPCFVFRINHLATIPWVGLSEATEQSNELDYFLACFSYVLQQNAHCFVHRQFVQERLDQNKRIYPALVDAVYAKKITPEHITRVLRELTLEKRSIKDMRLIMERLLDYAYLSDDPIGNAALDLPLTSSGKVNSDWFRDPMHVVDYIKDALPSYSV